MASCGSLEVVQECVLSLERLEGGAIGSDQLSFEEIYRRRCLDVAPRVLDHRLHPLLLTENNSQPALPFPFPILLLKLRGGRSGDARGVIDQDGEIVHSEKVDVTIDKNESILTSIFILSFSASTSSLSICTLRGYDDG